ncbi:MAG: ATP-dependent DNA helicase RecG [Candidatus Uhrbacteria bacterium]|nr:ATP-dependent DNA helicase RecG [Candidatus Uhrbacteria bacterium]
MVAHDAPVSSLPRVGPALQKQLKKIGIETCKDLIFYFPYRFDDFSSCVRVADLGAGATVTVCGRVDMLINRRSRNRRMIVTEGLVSDESGSIKVVWFNQPFLIKNLHVGDEVVLSGKTGDSYYDLQMVSPVYEKKSIKQDTIHTARLVPVYSLPANVTQKQFRSIVHSALKEYGSAIEDVLPQDILNKEELLKIEDALQEIHFPQSSDLFRQARRRFAFEELFCTQLFTQRSRSALEIMVARPVKLHRDTMKSFFSGLHFSFTKDQRAAAREILNDIRKNIPMNRLLQGDVGSGKTVVALLAMLNAVKSGYQCAFMAPTEILARQHFETLCTLFKKFDIRIALVTSSSARCAVIPGATMGFVDSKRKHSERDNILDALAGGAVDIIVGTHALIQEKVIFKNLALAVIDEQHRFGVRQRKLLKEKNSDGTMPHLLSMSATPIPRSLALTLYGDLDMSTIRMLPKGRKKITTKIVPLAFREWTYVFLKKQIKAGRQAFILCPVIDVSDALGMRSIREEYKRLRKGVCSDLRLGMLHGKMKKEEKEAVMNAMLDGSIDVLVSTTVIEVGIDVPNASVMLIEGAERFGLAQLHQLRGRVGRSSHQSYCFLMPTNDEKKELARLKALVQSNDGFALAEKDLELRGEGDVYGFRQAGLPQLKIATLLDADLIQKARDYACEYVRQLDRYPELRRRIDSVQRDVHLE